MADITVKCECGEELKDFKVETNGYSGIVIKVELCKACWEAAKQEARDEVKADGN